MRRLAPLMAIPILISCTQHDKKTESPDAARVPASAANLASETPRLVYLSYDRVGNASRDEILSGRWAGESNGFSDGGREDHLLKFYYANSRDLSQSGVRHAACFYGSAKDVQKAFFESGNNATAVRNVAAKWPVTRASSDGRMLGVRFDHKKAGPVFFRLVHCDWGKSTVSQVLKALPFQNRKPTRQMPKGAAVKASKGRKTASVGAHGFVNTDNAWFDESQIPRFHLRADYGHAELIDSPRPWAGLNLRDGKDAIRFSLMMQKYFYEGMANQDPRPDYNFIAERNPIRYWCHMPWMNVGQAGREAVHGMTQERDMAPSKKIPTYSNSAPGTNWGVAYFNAPGCRTLHRIFGSSSNPKPYPEFGAWPFENGTVSVKILFTTADFPEVGGAFTWHGNVSDVGETARAIRPVRHIQMDISIKDSALGGVSPALNNWAMLGYYYDPTYDYDRDLKPYLGEENPLHSIPNLPPALLKMRPIGVQTAFDGPETGDSIVFPGSFANGSGGRLNGPADNPRTSCLGCHGAAGTGASMVPGFLSADMFAPYLGSLSLDFNQQLALAKSNFETEITGAAPAH